MNRRHILSITLLITVLCGILWQSPPAILKELADDTTTEQKYPDAFLINSKVSQYNAQGNLSHIVISDRANFYETRANTPKSYTLLEKPRFTFYDEGKSQENTSTSSKTKKIHNTTWRATSDLAKSINNDEEILLSGNVYLVQRPHTKGVVATTINSEELLIKPNRQYAETNKPVTIKDGASVTTSTGFTLSLDTNTLELLSNVRSRYEPR